MTKTFTSSNNRKDTSLTVFSAEDNEALKAAICTNSATSYVRQLVPGAGISVPNHTARRVREHLVNLGWEAK